MMFDENSGASGGYQKKERPSVSEALFKFVPLSADDPTEGNTRSHHPGTIKSIGRRNRSAIDYPPPKIPDLRLV